MSRKIGVASAIWAFALLASRLIGLVRDSVLGHTLGVSAAGDAYQAAFRIPDWFQFLLAGGTLSIVFIPIFAGHIERGDEARGWRAFSVIANFLLVVMLVVGPVMWVFAPELARLLAPGFDADQHALLVHLTRIILPAQIFHVLGGLLSAALLSRDQHAVPALAPLLYSVGIIVGGVVGGSAEGFAWGVLGGAFAGPFLLPLAAALRQGLRWRPVLSFSDPDLRTYLVRWMPVLLGGSFLVLDDTVLGWFASKLDAGSVATLGYAKTLMRAPMGIFGAAAGFASYPALTRLYLEGRKLDAARLVSGSTRRVLLLALGSQVGLTVAAPEVATVVYGTARISPERMEELGLSLGLFCLGLGAWSAQILLARAYYAQGRGWIPARLGLLAMALSVPVYALFAERWGAPGLAAASSVAVTLSVTMLAWKMRHDAGEAGGYAAFLLRAVPSTALAIATGLALRGIVDPPAWTRLDALVRGGALGVATTALFVGGCWVLRLPELHDVGAALARRLPARFRHTPIP